MVQIATTITFAATLVGFAMGKDHSSHNCCLETKIGWTVQSGWTQEVCDENFKGTAHFDADKCIEDAGHSIDGDTFYNLCIAKGTQRGYDNTWNKGAGYRGTC